MHAEPDSAVAWVELGLHHESQRAWLEAAKAYQHALSLNPQLFEAALNLGAVLTRLQRFDESEAAHRQAIALRPEAPATWSNLGAMLACQRRDADAEACCRHALTLDPDHRNARFNLGYLLMRQGRWHEGWLCLEAREGPAWLQSKLPVPRWTGEPLEGRALLVVSDAAHGDLIQMARYGQVLKAAGAGPLVLYAQPALQTLLARGTGFDQVLTFEDPLPQQGFDLWTPSMSVPHLLGTGLHNIPASFPYLHADPDRVAHWRAMLPPERHVGLVWRGNPLHEGDADRSFHDVQTLAPLGEVAGVRFINLQHAITANEQAALRQHLAFTALPAPLGDFDETAALVANMDLVITVDTSMAHLAGALGKPVWVLLHDHKTDWRWLDQRSDSPWYPETMRLFRQPRPGDWASVMQAVAQALQDWATSAP